MLPDSAGVEKNKVGIFGFFRKIKARFAEHTLNLLAVGDILLTTVCADERERFFAALANLHNFGDKLHIFNLFFRQFIGLNNIISQINAS